MPQESKNYRYVEKTVGETKIPGFQLLKPKKWKGIVIAFTEGGIGKIEADGKAAVVMNYQILDNRGIPDVELYSQEFIDHISDIFIEVTNYILESDPHSLKHLQEHSRDLLPTTIHLSHGTKKQLHHH